MNDQTQLSRFSMLLVGLFLIFLVSIWYFSEGPAQIGISAGSGESSLRNASREKVSGTAPFAVSESLPILVYRGIENETLINDVKKINRNLFSGEPEDRDQNFETMIHSDGFSTFRKIIAPEGKRGLKRDSEYDRELASDTLERNWGVFLDSGQLGASEASQARELLRDIHVRNSELQRLYSAGNLSKAEYVELYSWPQTIEEKLSELLGRVVGPSDRTPISAASKLQSQERLRVWELELVSYPEFAATTVKDAAELDALLAAGANPNGVRPHAPDESLLGVAIIHRSPEMVESLLNYGADVETRDKLGLPMLHVAVFGGNAEIVQSLLEAGADPTVRGPNGNTPSVRARLQRLMGEEGESEQIYQLLRAAELSWSP